MNDRFFPSNIAGARIMLFADGENLAIRFGKMLGDGTASEHVGYEPNVYAWSRFLNRVGDPQVPVLRRYYYTSVRGDTQKQDEVHDQLSRLGIEAPRVFKRDKTKGSKQVDIALATEMLTHAHRRNYDLAVLVGGDEDYVPLVEATTLEGARVVLWFVENGLSKKLQRAVDHYFDLSHVLFAPSAAAMTKREIDYLHG